MIAVATAADVGWVVVGLFLGVWRWRCRRMSTNALAVEVVVFVDHGLDARWERDQVGGLQCARNDQSAPNGVAASTRKKKRDAAESAVRSWRRLVVRWLFICGKACGCNMVVNEAMHVV